RNAVAHGIGEPRGLRNKLILLRVPLQGTLCQRAGEQFQQLRIDLRPAPEFLLGFAHCSLDFGSLLSRASAISVIAISVSARALRSDASSSACFSAGP